MDRQIPTLRVERIDSPAVEMIGAVSIPAKTCWVVVANSYCRDAPSGLGSFLSEDEATAAMDQLRRRLDDQRARKGPSKAALRKAGAD